MINGHPILVHQEGGQVSRPALRSRLMPPGLPRPYAASPGGNNTCRPPTAPPSQGRGTAWAVWDGAAAAAKYLEAAAVDLLARHAFSSVLELGSGTGLAGLAAAAALQLPTLLTDLPEALPALQRNIAANASLAQLVAAAPLDWRDPSTSPALRGKGRGGGMSSSAAADDRIGSSGSGGRLVLAADCVWLEELVQPFVSALELAAAAPADRALLAYQSRSERIDDLLFGLLQRSFEVATVPLLPGELPRGPIDLYWLTPKPAAAAVSV